MWEKWRFVIGLMSVAFVVYSAWAQQWFGVGVAGAAGGGWWWLSSRAIARLAAAEPPISRPWTADR